MFFCNLKIEVFSVSLSHLRSQQVVVMGDSRKVRFEVPGETVSGSCGARSGGHCHVCLQLPLGHSSTGISLLLNETDLTALATFLAGALRLWALTAANAHARIHLGA